MIYGNAVDTIDILSIYQITMVSMHYNWWVAINKDLTDDECGSDIMDSIESAVCPQVLHSVNCQ